MKIIHSIIISKYSSSSNSFSLIISIFLCLTTTPSPVFVTMLQCLPLATPLTISLQHRIADETQRESLTQCLDNQQVPTPATIRRAAVILAQMSHTPRPSGSSITTDEWLRGNQNLLFPAIAMMTYADSATRPSACQHA